MRRLGADGTAFDTIVAFGEQAAEPHHHPGDRPLRRRRPGQARLRGQGRRLLRRHDPHGRARHGLPAPARPVRAGPRRPGGRAGLPGGRGAGRRGRPGLPPADRRGRAGGLVPAPDRPRDRPGDPRGPPAAVRLAGTGRRRHPGHRSSPASTSPGSAGSASRTWWSPAPAATSCSPPPPRSCWSCDAGTDAGPSWPSDYFHVDHGRLAVRRHRVRGPRLGRRGPRPVRGRRRPRPTAAWPTWSAGWPASTPAGSAPRTGSPWPCWPAAWPTAGPSWPPAGPS